MRPGARRCKRARRAARWDVIPVERKRKCWTSHVGIYSSGGRLHLTDPEVRMRRVCIRRYHLEPYSA
jgi:hypothetical protein